MFVLGTCKISGPFVGDIGSIKLRRTFQLYTGMTNFFFFLDGCLRWVGIDRLKESQKRPRYFVYMRRNSFGR